MVGAVAWGGASGVAQGRSGCGRPPGIAPRRGGGACLATCAAVDVAADAPSGRRCRGLFVTLGEAEWSIHWGGLEGCPFS